MRSTRKFLTLCALAVLLTLPARAGEKITLEGEPSDVPASVEACIEEANDPTQLVTQMAKRLECPECCGWGIWLPAAAYINQLKWEKRGRACPEKIKNAVVRAVASANIIIAAANRRADLHKAEADDLRAMADTPILKRVLRVGLAGIAGGGVGLAGGGVLVAATDTDLTEGLVSGSVIGAVVAIVGALVVELMD